MIDDAINIRLKDCQVELEQAEQELSILIESTNVYDDETAAQQCDHLLMKIDMLSGELESILNSID